MKAKTSWVLIADGARARIVRRKSTHDQNEAQPYDLVFQIDHKMLDEIMSDRPGRSFASVGARRSAIESRSEPKKHQEARFADTLVEELERRLRAREFERLAIIGEPRMLGTLRRKFSPALEQTVVAEFTKDLTKVCRQDLEATIAALGI